MTTRKYFSRKIWPKNFVLHKSFWFSPTLVITAHRDSMHSLPAPCACYGVAACTTSRCSCGKHSRQWSCDGCHLISACSTSVHFRFQYDVNSFSCSMLPFRDRSGGSCSWFWFPGKDNGSRFKFPAVLHPAESRESRSLTSFGLESGITPEPQSWEEILSPLFRKLLGMIEC